MGRPIHKKYFGNTNTGGTGGEGIASVAVGTAGTGYSTGLTTTVAAPGMIGGTTAVVTPVVSGAGAITSFAITNSGSGYLTAPTVTLVAPAAATAEYVSGSTTDTLEVTVTANTIYVGMEISGTGTAGETVLAVSLVGNTATVTMSAATTASSTLTFTDIGASGVVGTVTLTSGRVNAIAFTAVTVGVTARTNSDAVSQKSSRRYRIRNTDGTAICKLVAAVPTVAGTCSITATDSVGGTYFVTKLTAHAVTLVQDTGTQFASGVKVKWSFGAAVLNSSVSIANV